MTVNSLGLPNGVTFGNESLTTYDEGSWTTSDASGAGLTITTARGKYVRIGDIVFINGVFGYPVTANGSIAKISIPIPTTNESNSVNVLSGTVVSGLVGSTGLSFYNASAGNITNADLSNKTVYITGFYNLT